MKQFRIEVLRESLTQVANAISAEEHALLRTFLRKLGGAQFRAQRTIVDEFGRVTQLLAPVTGNGSTISGEQSRWVVAQVERDGKLTQVILCPMDKEGWDKAIRIQHAWSKGERSR